MTLWLSLQALARSDGYGVYAQLYSVNSAPPPPPPPPATTVYVDDTWTGTANGTDPANDPIGGLVFGYNAFADLQSAINAVAASGTVIVYGGSYAGGVNVNKALTDIEIDTNATTPAQTLAALNGAITVSQDTTFVTGTADLTFGSTVDDSASGTHNLTINGTGHAIDFGAAVGTTPLATLTVSASQSLTLGSSLSASGLISLTSQGGFTFHSVSAGSLFSSSGGSITNAASANLSITGNAHLIGASIDLGNQTGDTVNFGSLDASSSGTVSIAQDSTINLNLVTGTTVTLSSTGSILDNNGASNNISATSAALNGTTGIGTSGDAIETAITNLAADPVATMKGVAIANVGNLTIATVGSMVGITAAGNIDVSTTGDLTVNQAVSSSVGTVHLTGGAAGAGNAITLNVAVAGTSVLINGGAGADTITVNALGTTAPTLDGLGGSDTYIVNWQRNGREQRHDQHLGQRLRRNRSSVIINGDANANTFNVSETQTVFSGTGTVSYTNTLEQLRVNGLAGNDTFNVSPSRFATMLIDGGKPIVRHRRYTAQHRYFELQRPGTLGLAGGQCHQHDRRLSGVSVREFPGYRKRSFHDAWDLERAL